MQSDHASDYDIDSDIDDPDYEPNNNVYIGNSIDQRGRGSKHSLGPSKDPKPSATDIDHHENTEGHANAGIKTVHQNNVASKTQCRSKCGTFNTNLDGGNQAEVIASAHVLQNDSDLDQDAGHSIAVVGGGGGIKRGVADPRVLHWMLM